MHERSIRIVSYAVVVLLVGIGYASDVTLCLTGKAWVRSGPSRGRVKRLKMGTGYAQFFGNGFLPHHWHLTTKIEKPLRTLKCQILCPTSPKCHHLTIFKKPPKRCYRLTKVPPPHHFLKICGKSASTSPKCHHLTIFENMWKKCYHLTKVPPPHHF